MEKREPLFDAIAVGHNGAKTNKVRVLDVKKTSQNAEAIVKMAVIRTGCDEEFFTTVPTGKYKEGDAFHYE